MTFPSKDHSPHSTTPPLSDEQLFHSETAHKLKQEICEMGRRMWMREYCDANGGNLSCRLAHNRFLITPTGVSKGFMKPEMLCLVDGNGTQILPTTETWKRSTEFLAHLAIYQTVPNAAAVCHAHPCHAGAFAIKELEPPSRLIPEMEIFVGQIPVASYETPGSPKIAASIAPLAPNHQSILLGLHGLICWGNSVEDAYFKVEITDAYCRTILLAQPLPGKTAIPADKMVDLMKWKERLGLPDSRLHLTPTEFCPIAPWEQLESQPNLFSATIGKEEAPLEKLLEKIIKKLVAELKPKD